MNPIEALHNAVRWYCTEGFNHHLMKYSELSEAGGERSTLRGGELEFTDAAWDLFPRYRLLAAIRSDVEHYTPADFNSVDDLRAMLEAAGETAQIDSTSFDLPVAVRTMADERRKFLEYVRSVGPAELAAVPPQPFRRVLDEPEHTALHEAFMRRWGKWYGGGVDAAPPGSDAATLHVEAMEKDGAYDDLRRALSDHGVRRMLELREWGDGYELDVEAAEFNYTGAEGFWTDRDMAWMVYASHESSITFGGAWLIARMRACLPGFERFQYRGWDLSLYD